MPDIPEYVSEPASLSRCDVRGERGQVTADGGLAHERGKGEVAAIAERGGILVLGNPVAR